MTNIWDYIDGTLGEKEAAALKEQIETNPVLKAEWQERLRLHHALTKMESDQPSMRFAQNVMDKLPELYQKVLIKPLISKNGIRFFWMLFTSCLVGLTFSGISGSAAVPTTIQETMDRFFDLPIQLYIVLASITLGFVFFYFLDRFLRKKFVSQN